MAERGVAMQASFGGFELPTATDRLFLALFPDTAAAARISTLAVNQCAQQGLRGRPLPTNRLHVTLFHLGDWVGVPQNIVHAASDAAARLKAEPFDVTFNEVVSFAAGRDKKPFVLKTNGGNAALHEMHARLARLLGGAGLLQPNSKRFEPHVTLAYDAFSVAAEAVEPISWRATELVLVHSLLGRSQHVVLGRWPIACID